MSNDKERSPRRSRRWLQYGLSTLLLVVLLAAALVIWKREPLDRWVESLSVLPPERVEPVDLSPRVILRTTLGDVIVRLNVEKAPVTVESFLQYVDEGFYTDTIFHEVRRGDVIIGGGYTADLKQKPTPHPPIRNEAHNGLKNVRGAIAMVRQPNVIDSSTSQFFFDLGDNSGYLDPVQLKPGEQPEQFPHKYGYCVFGEVVAGMDVLDAIAGQQVSDKGGWFPFLPDQPVVIKSAERVVSK